MEYKNPVTAEIRLLGERIVLRTTDNDPEFTSEVLDLVSSRLESVEKRIKGEKAKHQVTLLALLDIAEEYVRAKKRTADYMAEIERRSEALMKQIEIT